MHHHRHCSKIQPSFALPLLLLLLNNYFSLPTALKLSVNVIITPKSTAISPACGATNVKSSFGTNSLVPQAPCVPTLAYDQNSIWLVWNKPDNYTSVVDYSVYANGKKLGSASANAASNSPAQPYIAAFYKEDTAGFHTKITYHSFLATGLQPNTVYTFTVRSVNSSGNESADSAKVTARTAPAYAKTIDVSTLGAKGDGQTVNTVAIQKAIDQCANSSSVYGCRVLIPAGSSSGNVFVTGALLLQSQMTLEIAGGATLKGSTNASDYPLSKGYQIYSYFTNSVDDRRPPSLLNALSANHRNGPTALTDHQGYDETRVVFTNIRIVGKGTLDGSGWQRSSSDLVDEVGNSVAQFTPGSSRTWSTLGVLAKNQMEAAQAEAGGGTLSSTQNANYYSNRRSSLVTLRGVQNVFVGGLSLTNPAFHGVMFLECDNMVFANTVTQTFDINNADGVEFGNSNGAVVFNNVVNSGDDCINFAAGQGKEYETGKEPEQNTWIFNNYMREGHGAVAIGSHTGAWVQDMLAEDNVAFLTDNGLRIKSTPATGGGARRVVFRDNAMREVGTKNSVSAGGKTFTNNNNGNAFVLTLAYSAGSNEFSNAAKCAQFSQITVQRVTVDNGNAAKGAASVQVDGYDGADSTLPYPETFQLNLTMANVSIKNAKATSISRLKDSTFTDVTITGWGSGSSPWAISNSSNLQFVSVSPAPAGF